MGVTLGQFRIPPSVSSISLARHVLRISSAGKGRCACEKLKKRRQILGQPSQAQFQPQLRDGLLMTPGQHRAEAQRMRRAGQPKRFTLIVASRPGHTVARARARPLSPIQ
jgi:hypothetical protein